MDRSEGTYRSLLDTLGDAVVMVGRDQRIVEFNRQAEQTFGYSRAEVLGRPLSILLPAETRVRHARHVEAFAGGPEERRLMEERTEVRGLRRDGSEFAAEISIAKVFLEGQALFSAIIRDVTNRKALEGALAASRRQLAQLADALPVRVALLDAGGTILYVNKTWRDLEAQRDAGPLFEVGRNYVDAAFARTPRLAGADDYIAGLRDVLAGSRDRATLEYSRGAGGGQRWYLVIASAFEPGRPNGAVITHIEITEQRAAQARLGEALERAEAASFAKLQFLANMSHELRSPLNAVIGFAELLAADLEAGEARPLHAQYARNIEHSGQRLLEHVEDIMSYSQIEVGDLELCEEVIATRSLFDWVARRIANLEHPGGPSLAFRIGPGAGRFLADPRLVQQALLHIVRNAMSYTQRGTVEVTATVEAELCLVLSVSDTGIGMRPEEILVALAPFRQIDEGSTRRYEGVGLGLPLAKKFIERHNARFDITSVPGRGTKVTMTLPGRAVIEEGDSAPPKSDAREGTRGRAT